MEDFSINCFLSETTLTCTPGRGGVLLCFRSSGTLGSAPRDFDFLLSYQDAEQLSQRLATRRDIETCAPRSGKKLLGLSYYFQDCVHCVCYEDPDGGTKKDSLVFVLSPEDQGRLSEYLKERLEGEQARRNIRKGTKPVFGL